MGFNLGSFFMSGLLALNALAILNEERFLAKSMYYISCTFYSSFIAFYSWIG